METRYHTLRLIGSIYKVLGVTVAIVTVLVVVPGGHANARETMFQEAQHACRIGRTASSCGNGRKIARMRMRGTT
ncbi:MAG: hypothetical protein GEV06_20060 [Luteitalea sp.]|nr:hypothetical protein [Luteitalea sp.]